MSHPVFAVNPSLYQCLPCGAAFTNGATAIRPVVDGSKLVPTSAGAISPALFGGGAILDLNATSTDAVARDIQLYEGRVATTQGGSTGTLSTAAGSITRQTGSWITEGWRAGQGVILITPDTLLEDAQSGIFAVVTGVSALALTLSGTPLSVNAGLAAGTQVVRARPVGRVSLAALQGYTTGNAAAPVDVITTLSVGRTARTDWKIGYNDMLLANVLGTVTAGAVVSLGGSIAMF